MTKAELVKAISKKTELGREITADILEALTTTVHETLSRGDKVHISGLGIFYTHERAARMGTDPRTGEKIKIKACAVPGFKPATALKNAMNKSEARKT